MIGKPRPQIKDAHPYEPGVPVEYIAKQYGIDPERVVKLASNENPVGPSPLALQAMQQLVKTSNHYPDQHDLLQALATFHNLTPDHFVLGNGSNDVLDLIGRVYIGPGDEAVSARHSFVVYQLVTQLVGGRNVVTPADEQYGHDLAAMLQAITPVTKVVWIANPNNPTGTFVPYSDVREFLAQVPPEVIVVLDEAYNEYLKPEDRVNTIDWLGTFPNLILVRTFSKIYGLAGLRVGYGLASPEVANYLNRVRQPFNVNVLGLSAARAALSDSDFVTKSYQTNLDAREQLIAGLEQLGFKCLPAYGNFVTFRVGSTEPVYEELLRKGVIVRPLDGYGMPEWLRVTTGMPAENDTFLAELRDVLAK